jgi:hypothetical protein
MTTSYPCKCKKCGRTILERTNGEWWLVDRKLGFSEPITSITEHGFINGRWTFGKNIPEKLVDLMGRKIK